MSEFLELETRRKVYDLVSRNPGLHLSKIAELLKMRISLDEYHLLYLEKNGVILSSKEAGYSRYYIKGKIGTADKKILSILRQKIPLKIVLFLLKNDCSQHRYMIKNFDIAPSTLSYHLKKLVKIGIISQTSFGDDKGYSIINREELIRILMQYKPYSVIDGFADIWSDLKVDEL